MKFFTRATSKTKVSLFGILDMGLIGLYTLSALLACYFMNGYPLNDVDSRRYLVGADSLVEITYGSVLYPLFLRVFSWFDSLWSVIVFQNVLTALALLYLFKTLFEGYRVKSIIFCLIIPFTSYVIYTNMVMTDFFITVVVLSIVVFVLAKDIKSCLLSAAILLFGFIAHKGFFYVFLFVIFSLFFISFFSSININKKRLLLLAVMLFSSKFFLSPMLSSCYLSKHLSNREITVFCRHNYGLRDSKLLKDYILMECENGNNRYCKYINIIDQIQNKTAQRSLAIWKLFKMKASPICIYVKNNEQNCKDIITWIFSDPGRIFEYLKHQIVRPFILAGRANDLIIPANKKSLAVLTELYEHDYGFKKNKQIIIGKDFLDGYLPIYTYFLYANVLAILLIIVYMRKNNLRLNSEIKSALLIFSISVIGNLLFYGIMSTETNQRYMLRVTWLLPLSVYILLAHIYDLKRE